MKKKILILGSCLLLLGGCGKNPELKNGEEALVSFSNGKNISVNELYNAIKQNYGLQTLIPMIDTYVLESEFKNSITEAQTQADSTIEAMTESYGSEEALLEAIQSYLGYATIESYKKAVYLSYLQNKATEEYAKTLVTDKEIKKYYKNNIYGDVFVNHILITADLKKDMTDEEKTAAENVAQKAAEKIIKKLKTAKNNKEDVAKTFSQLVKEYSEDESTKDSDGALGYINYGVLSSEYDKLIKAALDLKNGTFSTKVITTELGYHVIYRVNQKEKAKLEDKKEEIISTLAEEKITNDSKSNSSKIVVQALQHYRKKYGMEIKDEDLKTDYAKYIQSLLSKSEEETE